MRVVALLLLLCSCSGDDDVGMNDPDWRRVGVDSRANNTTGKGLSPLGDPTRWGANFAASLVPTINPVDIISGQIIRVQCLDAYSRAWQVAGSIQAPDLLWALPNIPGGPVTPAWQVLLRVSFGVGQGVVVVVFDLRALTVLAIGSTAYVAQDDGASETRPWVISGGLFAQQISASVEYRLTGFTAGEIPPQAVTTAIALAPFNAGTGL